MTTTTGRQLPFVSVVIPAYNEGTLLPLCLQALTEQDYSGHYEIIVVDNHSTDLTPKIARLYKATVVFEPRAGVGFARQTGFMAARGSILCSTDADSVVPRNWISRIVSSFQKDKKLIALGGRFDWVGINTSFKLFGKLLSYPSFFLDMLMTGGSLYGVNFAVRRDAFQTVGGFRTDLGSGEDVDLSQRLKKIGKVRFFPGLLVKTSARRMDTGVLSVFRYIVANYFSVAFLHRSLAGAAIAIREHPFEAFGGDSNSPTALVFILVVTLGLFTIGFFPMINLQSISHVQTQDKVIALTFDDGPNEPYTSQVLSILKEKQVRATFFVVGQNVSREPEAARDIVRDGHIIANHSESHRRFFMAGLPDRILKNIQAADQDILAATGKTPRFYRPPYGYRTIWGDWILRKNGYIIFTWNDMTTDYWGTNPDKIVRNIVRGARPGGIIVLHDGGENHQSVSRDSTVAALSEVIDRLKKQGYRFVTLDELTGEQPYF